LIIWLIFFLFLQTKPSFCRLFAWSQQDFSAIPVSISAVSLRRLSTYILLDFKVTKWAISSLTHSSNPFQVNIAKNKIKTGREKTSEKRYIKFLSFHLCVVTKLLAPSCFCLYSFCFLGRSIQQLNFECYRQKLLAEK